MKKILISALLMAGLWLSGTPESLAQRSKFNFNPDWHLMVSDQDSSEFFATPFEAKTNAKAVTLPYAFNEDEAFAVPIGQLTDTICWYYKTFRLPQDAAGKKVFIEFEGVRQAAEVWLNGHYIGYNENGICAFGFDLTPYISYEGENRIAVRVDNDWSYAEKHETSHTKYQWSNKNFNANYGGIPKNVFLHITGDLYQTLPLYSNLGTVGTYVYADKFDIKGKKADIHVEAEVKNDGSTPRRVLMEVEIIDLDGKQVARYRSKSSTIAPGEIRTISANKRISKLHFWSWGYGYLYTVKSRLIADGKNIDEVVTRTGFRKTKFGEGKIWLNDRVLMMKGFAQRTSNEWPAVGMSVPAWLSDYSNDLMVKCNANLVRWMHIAPWKQDVESCDRVGLIQAMPAGDAEKDCQGRQWEQRCLVMRDAIIYNRNNPSIVFYEGGNESISREHMIDLIKIRDQYDPHGGRAIGSREMLDINEAEYGGEMLYINKSKKHPMWAMEYCRDEGYRQYWDDYSYPYHRHGAGPYYRKAPADIYNQNMDQLTIENIRRWYDYWIVRPGMGKRVSSGGVKIIFSDTNTHNRSEFLQRTSGVTDAMRIPKDNYFAHQVMWNGWVEIEQNATYIIGHWNYPAGVKKDVYVVSTSPVVELFHNGKSLGKGLREYDFLHTFKEVEYLPGTLKAVGYTTDGVTAESEYSIQTAGRPAALRLTLIENPSGMKADGADMALIEVEVVDAKGRRCPLDNRLIDWTLEGPGEWRGGCAKSPNLDNHILDTRLPVEAGVNRVLVRSTTTPGEIRLTATSKGLPSASITFKTSAIEVKDGLSTYIAGDHLAPRLDRGETPLSPSYTDRKRTIDVMSAETAVNAEMAGNSFDDNELSEWRNDGKLKTAWITYTLAEEIAVDEISIKLVGWRQRSYPLEIFAEDTLIWKGHTPKSLGYVHLNIDKPVKAKRYTIKQVGRASDKEAFGQITEVAAATAGELDLYKTPNSDKVRGELRIVEIDFLKSIKEKQ